MTNSSAADMNEHVYYMDGGRVWTNFVAQPSPGISLVDPTPTEPTRGSRLTDPKSTRRAERLTPRDPFEEFYDLDSESCIILFIVSILLRNLLEQSGILTISSHYYA